MRKFFDYLGKNPSDAGKFYAIIFGLMFLWLASIVSKKDTDVYSGMLYVFGIVSVVIGIIFGLDVILRKKFNNKFLTDKMEFVVNILFIIILFPQLIKLNPNSVSYILMFIIIIYSGRIILFSCFMFALKSNGLSEEKRKFNASDFSFGITLFFLLGSSSFDFLFFKVFILFLVYGIYYIIRERYLPKSIESPIEGNITFKKSVFSEVWNMSSLVLYILLLMFLLFYFNVLLVSENQPTLYYFYSTSAQVFAALLGIVVMFSILILQKEEKRHADRRKILKIGLKGFTILYIIIIVLSITGILIKDTINFNPIEKIPEILNISVFRDVLNVAIFEIILLMIPVALLYLYAMISSFLNWEATFEIKSGQTILSDTIMKAEEADSITIEAKN